MVELMPSGGWWTQHLSREEIQEMKKNMQKVPEIQAKSEAYHKKESLKAEIEFEKAQKELKNKEEIIINEEENENTTPKIWRRKRFINKLFPKRKK